MKPVFKLTYTALLALVLMAPACNRRTDDNVSAAPETATEQAKEQREAYIDSVEAKLDEFDHKFDGLDERAGTMKGAAKDSFDASVNGLRDQRKMVGEKLDDLKEVSVESWTTMKSAVDSALSGLERSYEQVSATHETVPATGAH